MPMNTVIRDRRKALGLTQEQVAQALGVTAPAVNKWESGATAPDISLLPPLARLLQVDLNALFCFGEGLTEQEINQFTLQLNAEREKRGFAASFALGLAKTREYPACGQLLHQVALSLEGMLLFSGLGEAEKQPYADQIFALYQQAARCGGKTRDASLFMLTSGYIRRGEYARAQQTLSLLPAPNALDRRQLQAQLLLAQEKTAEAAKIFEYKLLNCLSELQGALMNLMTIAAKEGSEQDARQLAGLCRQTAELFGLSRYVALSPAFLAAADRQDTAACLPLLREMLAAAEELWIPPDSAPFRHVAGEYKARLEGKAAAAPALSMLPALLGELETNPSYAFLRESSEFKRLLARYRAKYPAPPPVSDP